MEGRIGSEQEFYKLYPEFEYEFYRMFYPDLGILFNNDKYLLMRHYEDNGKMEGRIGSEQEFYKLYPEFNLEFYIHNYADLSIFNEDKYLLMSHYFNNGLEEGRISIKQDLQTIIELNPKEEFRKICIKNLNYIRNIDLLEFSENSHYESVLIEFRCLPHLEFLIRNTIIKLGEKWSHTIICGQLNYEFIVNMCLNISNKIKVIKTNFDNLFPSDYSRFLSSLNFWDLINGEKILIYQEDTCIFKNNIDDFLHWDYIGAPWFENQNDNNKGIGNGGLSLRSKSIMKKIIESKGIMETKYNLSTLIYIKNTNSSVPPEDVYFTKNMEDLNIGLLADRESAFNFSTESLLNKDSFGGHQFWLNDPNWKERIYENVVIQLKPEYEIYINDVSHRGGWKDILNSIEKNNMFNKTSKIHFYDTVEIFFLIKDYICIEDDWCGIIHWTPNVPKYLNYLDLEIMFEKENFIKSLRSCIFLISLSNHLTKYLKRKLIELKVIIPVYTLKHPVDIENIILFDYNNYVINNSKKLIQVGQQLRKVTSIYLLNLTGFTGFEKIWLTGTKHFQHCDFLIENECKYLNIDQNTLDKNVKMYYTNTFEEYDELLSKNIVFVDLFDAAANNTVLECIIRNTPIIINKIEPVVEYLGEDYPLYFEKLEEVPLLLHNSIKILEAHNYLCKMDKRDLSIDYFVKNLINIHYFENNKNYFKYYISSKENLFKFISSRDKIVCVYSPYDFSLGGGEKYLSEIIKFFIDLKYIVIFFNFTDKNKVNNLLKFYIGESNINNVIHVSDKWLFDSLFINRIKKYVDYFIYMHNFSIPKLEGFAKSNIYHCQFPFEIDDCNYEREHYTDWGETKSWSQSKRQNFLNSYNNIIVNSEFTKKNMEKVYSKNNILYKQNIDILYPLCYDNINKVVEKEENTFIMIGRIFEHNTFANNKRFDIAINIFNQITTNNYKLIIIGSVKSEIYYQELKNLCINNKNIEIIKDADEETKNKWLVKAKYYIQLTGMEDISVCCQEHFGISLIEAITYKCIPICFNGGYAPYIVKNNYNGYLINTREELQNKVEDLINNSNEKTISNYDFHLEKYNKENYISTLNKIISI
jgi:hypothetical protein